MWKTGVALLSLGVALVAVACGGGGGGNGTAGQTVTRYSQGNLDGYVSEGHIFNAINGIEAGDRDAYVNGDDVAGFLTFDLTGLGPASSIQTAVLRCYQSSVEGAPYLKLMHVVVDLVDYGDELTGADYAVGADATSPDALSFTDDLGWKTLDITNYVQSALALGRTRCQLRLRFVALTFADGQNDWAKFEDGENSQGTGNLPQLVVTRIP